MIISDPHDYWETQYTSEKEADDCECLEGWASQSNSQAERWNNPSERPYAYLVKFEDEFSRLMTTRMEIAIHFLSPAAFGICLCKLGHIPLAVAVGVHFSRLYPLTGVMDGARNIEGYIPPARLGVLIHFYAFWSVFFDSASRNTRDPSRAHFELCAQYSAFAV